MIFKIMHHYWFGANPVSLLAKKCINIWKKYCGYFREKNINIKQVQDGDFEKIIKKIQLAGRLGEDNRIGLILKYSSIGDIYYAFSAMQYFIELVRKLNIDKKLILISDNKFSNEFLDYFKHHNLNCETLVIEPHEYQMLLNAEMSVILKYNSFIWKMNRRMRNILYNNTQFFTPLVKPEFPDFNADFYLNKYNIKPGKTFFIVPLSTYVKPLPIYFWNFCAEIFKFIGYDVLFNVPDDMANLYNGKNCYVPFKDAVGLADLCGNIFAMRTGFVDFISTTKANMTIFSSQPFLPLDKVYHIDNSDSRIKTIYFDSDLDFESFNPIRFITEHTDSILSGFKYQLETRENSNNISFEEAKIPDIETYGFIPHCNEARYNRWDNKKYSVCSCKYSFELDENMLKLQIFALDIEKYYLNISLKHNDKIIQVLNNYNILSVIFKPKFSGEYKFEVCIHNKKDLHLQVFITEPIFYNHARP